jgi:ribosome-associated protein
LEKTVTALQEPKKTGNRLTRNTKLFKTIIKSIQDKKGNNILSLDLRKIDEAVADFFILCEGSSHIQVRAIADNIVEEIWKQTKEKPFHFESGDHWTLVDYVNVVVHVFQPEQRHFYNLEGLWGDALQMEHND